MMRLKPHEVDVIEAAAAEAFGPDAAVRLFGSRVDDSLRGGDIDLPIEMEEGQDSDRHEARFLDRSFERIDEQKVDEVFTVRGKAMPPFAKLVARDAVPL
jgi:predicted nucleotidyltransferase